MSSRKLRLSFPMVPRGFCAGVGLANWETYLTLDSVLSQAGLRVRYLRGVFEIMSFCGAHEYLKSVLGILVDAFCLSAGIDYFKWGSSTNRQEGIAAAEPDESFTFGPEEKPKPDIVIEVAFSSGGIDKCELWAELGAELEASEIWIWENDRIHAFDLRSGEPEPIEQSRVLSGLHLAKLEDAARIKPTSAARRAFIAKLG